MRRILLTHTDLDGVGCAVLFHKCFPTDPVVFTNYDEVDQHVLSNLYFDQIWITDLSIKKETLDRISEEDKHKLNIVDHHKTAEWLNDALPGAYVDTAACGTRLLYEILMRDYHIDDMRLFTELVNDHDLYKHQMVGSAQMSRLRYVMGLRPFFERLCNDSKCKVGVGLLMTPGEELLLKCDDYKFLDYHSRITGKAIILTVRGYQCVVAFAEQYISEIAHKILEDDPHIEAVFLVNMTDGHVSLRSRGNLDCSDYAQQNGGGGHPKAAGFRLNATSALLQMWGIGNEEQA